MAAVTETSALLGATRSQRDKLSHLPLYTTIWTVYREVVGTVDVPLSAEQLRSPEIQIAIIQPLEALFGAMRDPSLVYVLLLCRLQFIRERDETLASSSLSETRASLCELLAIKLLRHQATEAKGSQAGLLAMATALVGGFHAFQGAGDDVLDRVKQKEGYASRIMTEGAGKTNALELAILGKARNFIKSQGTQRVITAIWEGRIVYSSSSFLDILPDRYKLHEIKLYDLSKSPVLDHYRLRVPKYRAYIDFMSFLILFASFIAVIIDRRKYHSCWEPSYTYTQLENKNTENRHESLPVSKLTAHEVWFFTFALGYALDKIASVMEHGWSVYSAGLTNGLDALCIPVFAVAFGFRIHSIVTDDAWASDQAFAVLSVAACLMFPRLAFAVVSRNLLILSLRAMLADFFWLMGIAIFCFLGFVFALQHLCDGLYSVSRIAEWLIFIWFGLDGIGIDRSPVFHSTLGPALFISYAALSNTLLVSLLVAILSGTYAAIAADADAEDMFRRAVLTFEGVKADAVFDYFPPLNLIALGIMWPVSKVTSPRWFHKINVAFTRTFSLPVLLIIAFYERQAVRGSPIRTWASQSRLAVTKRLPTQWAHKVSLLEGAHWECEAVFEYSPSGDEESDSEEEYLATDDEVQDLIEGATQRNRIINNRASMIIDNIPGATNPPPLSTRGSSDSSSPIPFPTSPASAKHPPSHHSAGGGSPKTLRFKPPPRANQHAHFATHERLPSNASARVTMGGRSTSPERYDSALGTSPSTHFTSPLSELYHQREGEGVQGGGIRRRLSMGPAVRPPFASTAPAQDQSELRDMISSLAEQLKRLEAKLDK